MPRLKRKANSKPLVYGSASSSSDDPDFDVTELKVSLASTTATKSRRKPQSRKTVKNPNRSSRKRVKNSTTFIINPNDSLDTNSSIINTKECKEPITLDDTDDDYCSFIQSNLNDIKTNAEEKVNNFFKSSGLISDDEDLEFVRNENKEKKQIPIIDSSKPSCSTDTEQLIIIEDDTTQINSLAEIEDYCKETENLLKNANALLEKFAGPSKSEESRISDMKAPNSDQQQKGLGDCPICLERLSEMQVMSTKCGHLFCKGCIEKVAMSVKRCPTCRKVVNKKNIISIYI
ncbi:hypothetical protein HHI36_010947 [Cryptolaemus montrouzieri]|uniref:RING-type domain-containing protein n=1 Tax=Cryptolaemus montrouzieri TaxID=559131 RepID=A0ABD2MKC6_9CUCU